MDDKKRGALEQLLLCARADCGKCVMNVEDWEQCLHVIKKAEEILREGSGDEQEKGQV